MRRPATDLQPTPHRRHHHHHRRGRKRWPRAVAAAGATLAVLAAAGVLVAWGDAIAARFQLRLAPPLRAVPPESASVALPPLCLLLALIVSALLGVVVYKLGRSTGFVAAGVITAVVFLMWVWAMSSRDLPLSSIELRHVQLQHLLYVLSFFTVVLVPLCCYFAWYRASMK
jgi:hypothetical protein